jgi:hypothetical protein
LRQSQGLEKIFLQDFAGRDVCEQFVFHNVSMVVHNFDCGGIGACPAEANSPLVVHPDAPLARAPAFQGFQPVLRSALRSRTSCCRFPSGRAQRNGKALSTAPRHNRWLFPAGFAATPAAATLAASSPAAPTRVGLARFAPLP